MYKISAKRETLLPQLINFNDTQYKRCNNKKKMKKEVNIFIKLESCCYWIIRTTYWQIRTNGICVIYYYVEKKEIAEGVK